MISLATIQILRIFLLLCAATLTAIKVTTISRYNKSGPDEPIAGKYLGRFSSMEIDGSYSAQRRKILLFTNRLTSLTYLLISLLALTFALPTIAAYLGLE